MYNNFKAISISHKGAPVAVRERVALSKNQATSILQYLKEYSLAKDVLVLSTCNRTEIYYTADEDLSNDLIKLICLETTISDIDNYKNYFETINDHDQACERLFRVAIGLESQVVGDLQITNQVKQAYQSTSDQGLAGPFLHRLLHTIFYTNKKVVQETPFRDGAASVSYAATELIEGLTEDIQDPTILVIGLGDIGLDVCKNLISNQHISANNITISNRTKAKAEKVAAETGFRHCDFGQLQGAIAAADVIISSVSVKQPLVTETIIRPLRVTSYKYFIDLSVPRSIDQKIENVSAMILYNLDDIRAKADQALQSRLSAIPQVEAIINGSIQDFETWTKEVVVSPTINKLKNALEQIRKDELARHLKDLDQKDAAVVEKITKNIMQKVIKLPVLQLKAACLRGEAESLVDLLNDLFDLEPANTKK
ncbi:MAG: glutamyl-tRNA reductase [Cyclobacteriaceae bacterium]